MRYFTTRAITTAGNACSPTLSIAQSQNRMARRQHAVGNCYEGGDSQVLCGSMFRRHDPPEAFRCPCKHPKPGILDQHRTWCPLMLSSLRRSCRKDKLYIPCSRHEPAPIGASRVQGQEPKGSAFLKHAFREVTSGFCKGTVPGAPPRPSPGP